MHIADQNGPVLYFDGVCNLCNNVVKWVIKHDKKKIFRFATLQSATGERLMQEAGIKLANSVLVVCNGRIYSKSTAALQVVKHVGGIYSLLYILVIIPRFLRDRVYTVIARNRYKWFGQQKSCMKPTPELKARFLD